MKAEGGHKLGFSRLWLICGLFFNHSRFVTINILIKALQIFVQVAHVVFIFMKLREIFVGPRLTSKFREMQIELIRSGVHNNMQINLTPREFLQTRSHSSSQWLCRGGKNKLSSFLEIKERKAESYSSRVTAGANELVIFSCTPTGTCLGSTRAPVLTAATGSEANSSPQSLCPCQWRQPKLQQKDMGILSNERVWQRDELRTDPPWYISPIKVNNKYETCVQGKAIRVSIPINVGFTAIVPLRQLLYRLHQCCFPKESYLYLHSSFAAIFLGEKQIFCVGCC